MHVCVYICEKSSLIIMNDHSLSLTVIIREISDQRERWTGIKRMKKDPQQRFLILRMINLQGEPLPPKNRAETIATYLEDKHWTNDRDFPLENRDLIQALTQQFNVEPFNLSEYDAALQTTKANKQPGPDNVLMELFKWMNHENTGKPGGAP